MSSPIAPTDLTRRPPRSMRVRLGGFVLLARMLDKGRALLAKRNGEYNYNSPTDQHLVRFLGLDPEALLQELASRKGDGEILQRVLTNAQTHAHHGRSMHGLHTSIAVGRIATPKL